MRPAGAILCALVLTGCASQVEVPVPSASPSLSPAGPTRAEKACALLTAGGAEWTTPSAGAMLLDIETSTDATVADAARRANEAMMDALFGYGLPETAASRWETVRYVCADAYPNARVA